MSTSPCVGLCTLDDDDVCIGCGRTLDEILHPPVEGSQANQFAPDNHPAGSANPAG